jgi:hypothetical protein
MFNRIKAALAASVAGARNLAIAGAVALTSLVASNPASAQIGFDPADVTAIVDEATTFITTVGLAVLVMLMVAKGIRWARKAG